MCLSHGGVINSVTAPQAYCVEGDGMEVHKAFSSIDRNNVACFTMQPTVHSGSPCLLHSYLVVPSHSTGSVYMDRQPAIDL